MNFWFLIGGWFLGIISSLGTTWLQSFLTKKQIKNQTLMEIRLAVYAELLAVAKSEERHPADPRAGITPEEVLKYNERVQKWRTERKAVKATASKALLLAKSSELRRRLSEFISSSDPDHTIVGIEEIMREEIGI
ncbi:MAG: hypothetical protein Q7R65_00825 [bacterium]|nr:hypothetical protein [bacterium]